MWSGSRLFIAGLPAVQNSQAIVITSVMLTAPDYASIRGCYFNHEVVCWYLISLDDCTYLLVVRVQNGPRLRNVIRFVVNDPHIIPSLLGNINQRHVSNCNSLNMICSVLSDVTEKMSPISNVYGCLSKYESRRKQDEVPYLWQVYVSNLKETPICCAAINC